MCAITLPEPSALAEIMTEDIEERRPGVDVDASTGYVQYGAMGMHAQALYLEINWLFRL